MAGLEMQFAPWLGVFETVRVIEGRPLFLLEHEAEFHCAAAALGLSISLDLPSLRTELPARSGRWRWIATREGVQALFVEEESVASVSVELSISTVRLGSQNWSARFKTVSYLDHAQALELSATPETVLLNEHGIVASAARSNIFWRRGERLFTPAHEAGCRRGVVRGFVLRQRRVEEGHFPLEDLLEADEIFLTNSMRGLVSVAALQHRRFETMPAADALRAEYARAAGLDSAHR